MSSSPSKKVERHGRFHLAWSPIAAGAPLCHLADVKYLGDDKRRGRKPIGERTTTSAKADVRMTPLRVLHQGPVFWTPEFIELGARVLIWRDCRIEAADHFGEAR